MKTLLTLFLLSIIASANAQTITGKIINKSTNEPLGYVTVSLKDSLQKIIEGVITDEKGVFTLKAKPGRYTLEYSLMGYQAIGQPVILTSGRSADVGTISLTPDAKQLNAVTVAGQQPSTKLQLDKKVFEVGKDVLSRNGSLADVLNGVPSVTVGATGGVSLRGNQNVTVLINGRRSGLTQGNALEQLQADQIERIEVITNPSVRYDASGSAGIINIVLKKNKKAGFSGQLKLVAGSPNDTRINPSINYRSDKLNIFSTLGIRKSDYVGLYTTNQVVTVNNTPNYLNTLQNENRHDDGKLLYIGADYQLTDKRTITAAYLKNATRDHDKTQLNYDHSSTQPDSTLIRNGESWERRDYNQLEFNYTQLFTDPKKKWTIDMQYDWWNSDKDWLLNTEKIFPVSTTLPALRTSSVGKSTDMLIQTDLTQPLNASTTLEFGLKAENRVVSSTYLAQQQLNNMWQTFMNINNDLEYDERIYSAYAQLNSKINKFSYQLGLRTEATRVGIADRNNTYNNTKNYTRLFPALHLNYALNANSTLQGSYSKRINRPQLYALYPFNEITDRNAQNIGNPDLNPSYADVVELGVLYNKNGATINPSFYYQHITSPIQDYTYRNADNIFITIPINITKEVRRGFELAIVYSPVKALQLNAEGNLYSFQQYGSYATQSFDIKGNAVTARFSAQVKLPLSLSAQGRYNFSGAISNAQTRRQAIHSADMGISKNLFKDKVNVVADVANAFNSRKYVTRTTGLNYVIDQTSNPNSARYRLSVVYKLNINNSQRIREAKSGNRN